MRLFEVDQGDALAALQVLKGLADQRGGTVTMPFPEVQKFVSKFNLAIGSVGSLQALINTVDPQGNTATINDDGTVTLTTKSANPNKPSGVIAQPKGPSIDAMASKNARTFDK